MERQHNDMMDGYLKTLEDNLAKKNKVLDELLKISDKQMRLLDIPAMSVEDFDACMEEQDVLTEELTRLNEEADGLYECLQAEPFQAHEQCAAQMERMQAMIAQIMDKSTSLQEKEQSNKQKLEEYFRKERKNFGEGRRSSKAALDYYKSMSRSNVIPPQFMDKKK